MDTLTARSTTSSTSATIVYLPTTTEWSWWRQTYFQGQDDKQSGAQQNMYATALFWTRYFVGAWVEVFICVAGFVCILAIFI
jgi:hypothetical protein